MNWWWCLNYRRATLNKGVLMLRTSKLNPSFWKSPQLVSGCKCNGASLGNAPFSWKRLKFWGMFPPAPGTTTSSPLIQRQGSTILKIMETVPQAHLGILRTRVCGTAPRMLCHSGYHTWCRLNDAINFYVLYIKLCFKNSI